MAVGEVFPVGNGILADDADVQRTATGIAFLVVCSLGWEVLNLAETLMNQPLNGLFEAGEHIERLVVDEQAVGHPSARPSRFSASSKLIQRAGSGSSSLAASFSRVPCSR